MADAYKLKADATFPEVIRTSVNINGVEINETQGRTYDEGDYVLAEKMTPRDRKRAAEGELDHLLEAVDRAEAEAALGVVVRDMPTPEHQDEPSPQKDSESKVEGSGAELPSLPGADAAEADAKTESTAPRQRPRRRPQAAQQNEDKDSQE